MLATYLGGEFFVLEAAWFVFGDPQSFAALVFIVLVVALAPVDVAVTFEGEDVSRDAVEEPTIVTGYHDAAGVVQDCFFKGTWAMS